MTGGDLTGPQGNISLSLSMEVVYRCGRHFFQPFYLSYNRNNDLNWFGEKPIGFSISKSRKPNRLTFRLFAYFLRILAKFWPSHLSLHYSAVQLWPAVRQIDHSITHERQEILESSLTLNQSQCQADVRQLRYVRANNEPYSPIQMEINEISALFRFLVIFFRI